MCERTGSGPAGEFSYISVVSLVLLLSYSNYFHQAYDAEMSVLKQTALRQFYPCATVALLGIKYRTYRFLNVSVSREVLFSFYALILACTLEINV